MLQPSVRMVLRAKGDGQRWGSPNPRERRDGQPECITLSDNRPTAYRRAKQGVTRVMTPFLSNPPRSYQYLLVIIAATVAASPRVDLVLKSRAYLKLIFI